MRSRNLHARNNAMLVCCCALLVLLFLVACGRAQAAANSMPMPSAEPQTHQAPASQLSRGRRLGSAPQNIRYLIPLPVLNSASSCCLCGGGGDEGQQAARLGGIVSGPDVCQGVALPHLALVLLQAGEGRGGRRCGRNRLDAGLWGGNWLSRWARPAIPHVAIDVQAAGRQ